MDAAQLSTASYQVACLGIATTVVAFMLFCSNNMLLVYAVLLKAGTVHA